MQVLSYNSARERMEGSEAEPKRETAGEILSERSESKELITTFSKKNGGNMVRCSRQS